MIGLARRRYYEPNKNISYYSYSSGSPSSCLTGNALRLKTTGAGGATYEHTTSYK